MINDENTAQPESSNAGGIKETVRETKEKLKTKASEAASRAKDRGQEYLRSSKERTANRIEGYSESMRHAAERFEREEDPNLAHYTGLLADKLERAAGYVRDHDLRAVQHDVEDLARRHPAIFFGGMFVAGLAAARFLKASADRPQEFASEHHDEESSNGGYYGGEKETMRTEPSRAQSGQGFSQDPSDWSPGGAV